MPTQAEAPEAEEKRGPGRPRKVPLMKLRGLPIARGPQLERAVRDIKLVRPVCHICAPEVEAAGHGWWNRCEHDPYVGEKGFPETIYEYDDELDDEGNIVGRLIREGYPKTKTVLRPWPNLVGVAQSRRLNSNRGVEYKTTLYGYITPEELRSPAYPGGIAPMCEFRDCYNHDHLKTYGDLGTFCQEREAIMVYEDTFGIVPEIVNQNIRADQWATSLMKVNRGK
jgi:hypothetical protein